MKKVFAFLVLFMLLNLFPVYAESSRANIDLIDFRQYAIVNGTMHGSFEIRNTTNVHEENLFYTLSLAPASVDSASSSMVLHRASPEKFSLTANETKTIFFKYMLPSYMPKDEYNLVLEFSDKTSNLGISSQIPSLKLGSQSEFISSANPLKASYYKINGFESALSGPYFNSGTSPDAFISLKSSFSKSLSLTPEFTVYKRLDSFLDKPVSVTYGDDIVFKPFEEKEVKVSLPVVNEPDSYFIKVVFLNNEKIPVSNEYYFRYVVNGTSAKISYISTIYNNENKQLKVYVGYIGSPDSHTLNGALFVTSLYETNTGNTLEGYADVLDLYPTSYSTSYSAVLEDPKSPLSITAKLSLDGKELASETVNLSPSATSIVSPLFEDVKNTPYEYPVKALYALDVLSGYPDHSFKPFNEITRAEFTSIALRLKGIPVNTSIEDSLFVDVTDSCWAKDIINTAFSEGIITGYSNDMFKPNDKITYSEVLTILLNVAGYKDEVALSDEIWPYNYISFAKQLMLLKGSLIPDYNSPASRGEISIITLWTYIMRKV